MDDAAFVGVREGPRHVLEDAHRPAHLERALALDPRSQRLAFDERHREVRHAVDLARGEHPDDMWMLQSGREHDLALETFHRHAGGEILRQDLHDDPTSEGGVERDEHARHAAARELTLDGVTAAERLLKIASQIDHRRNLPACAHASMYSRHGDMTTALRGLTPGGARLVGP